MSVPTAAPAPRTITAIPQLVQQNLDLWNWVDDSRPNLGPEVSPTEQARHGFASEEFLNGIESQLRESDAAAGRSAFRERFIRGFARFAGGALDFGDNHVRLLTHGFLPFAENLAVAARHFDANISSADIYQASRNAWTAGALARLFGREMTLTPPIFAYSLLYPYTDNYLDSPSTGVWEKSAFNLHLRRRLEGLPEPPPDTRARDIWRLISMIESTYARRRYPAVWKSLLAIQDAQARSVRLRSSHRPPSSAEVLETSIDKGGTSVLADAWLAAGGLTPEQAEFAFAWGVFLQLGDDLQDIAEDGSAGILTIFTEATEKEFLDRLTNRLFHFGDAVLGRLSLFPDPKLAPLKDLIRSSARDLLTAAVSQARQHYSEDYINWLERRSKLRFDYLSRRRHSFFGQRGLLENLTSRWISASADFETKDSQLRTPALHLGHSMTAAKH